MEIPTGQRWVVGKAPARSRHSVPAISLASLSVHQRCFHRVHFSSGTRWVSSNFTRAFEGRDTERRLRGKRVNLAASERSLGKKLSCSAARESLCGGAVAGQSWPLRDGSEGGQFRIRISLRGALDELTHSRFRELSWPANRGWPRRSLPFTLSVDHEMVYFRQGSM
jgi:hypothetical protein